MKGEHVISTQEIIYQGERRDRSYTAVACSCGVSFDNVPGRPSCFPIPNSEHCLTIAALITKHKIDVLSEILGVKFTESELDAVIYPY